MEVKARIARLQNEAKSSFTLCRTTVYIEGEKQSNTSKTKQEDTARKAVRVRCTRKGNIRKALSSYKTKET